MLSIVTMNENDFTLQYQELDDDLTLNSLYTIDHSYTSMNVLVRVSSESGTIVSCSHELSLTNGYSIYFDIVDTVA